MKANLFSVPSSLLSAVNNILQADPAHRVGRALELFEAQHQYDQAEYENWAVSWVQKNSLTKSRKKR
jgi:hypothetical protein